ncbi:MAG: hypothetical protein LIR50_00445 [Bacillota bacterium]|nr:hypothetical protein [Bacillota bacterium]
MKVKITEAVEFISVYPIIKEAKLKINTLYKISKYFDICNKERDFYIENLNKIFDEYGEKDESGNLKLSEDKEGIIIKPELLPECNQKLADLMAIEIDIPVDPISLSEIESLELDYSTFQRFKPFITE